MDHVGRTRREIANAEAARWVLDLACQEPTVERLRAFEAWRAQSPEHALAYEWMQLVWQRTERLRALRPPGDAVDAALLARIAASEAQSTEADDARPRRSRLPIAFALAASVLIACVVGWWSLARDSEPVLYSTAVGEQRSILLEDGSRLVLNTNTEVSVSYSGSARHVALLRGESLFDVEADAARPFIVDIGGRTVRAVGTAFNIRREEASATILVTEGVVEVAGRAEGAVRLPAGSIGFEGHEGVSSRAVAAGEIERTLSWRFGAIILAGETLADAAAEFNRYNDVQITVADASIAGLRLGGYFNARDVEAFVDVLAATYAIDVTTTESTIALRSTHETSTRMRDGGASMRPL